MLIRRLAVLTTTLVVVLSFGAPAHAVVVVTSTSLDQVEQRSPTPVVVELENRVERGDPREPERVAVGLDGGPEKGVRLPCVWDTTEQFQRRAVCEGDDVDFDPRTGAPFAGAPLANGDHELTVDLGEGREESVEVVQSVRGSAVTDLTARVDGADVTLSWTRAPEPDVSGYRVQRRSDGGDWTTVTTTGSDASGAGDGDRSAGDYQYRVLTVRPDGRGGDPFVTPSSVGGATVEPSPPSSSTGSGSSDPRQADSAGESGAGSSSDGSRASAPSIGTSSRSGEHGVSVAEPPSPGTGRRPGPTSCAFQAGEGSRPDSTSRGCCLPWLAVWS